MLKGKIFLLIDHNTESYTENIVSVGVQNNLVTTVGTPTAGNQSELSLVRLPGFYNYSKAVMEVSDRKGNNLVGIQIQPDYLVEHKISDIGKNHDSQLKKAIELAKNLKK
jgi:C-terminal processing protease CtpA/Prc